MSVQVEVDKARGLFEFVREFRWLTLDSLSADSNMANVESTEGRAPFSVQVSILPGIEHLVVLMFENRSFDNMLGGLYPNKSQAE